MVQGQALRIEAARLKGPWRSIHRREDAGIFIVTVLSRLNEVISIDRSAITIEIVIASFVDHPVTVVVLCCGAVIHRASLVVGAANGGDTVPMADHGSPRTGP
jgi:hypothetical protein